MVYFKYRADFKAARASSAQYTNRLYQAKRDGTPNLGRSYFRTSFQFDAEEYCNFKMFVTRKILKILKKI